MNRWKCRTTRGNSASALVIRHGPWLRRQGPFFVSFLTWLAFLPGPALWAGDATAEEPIPAWKGPTVGERLVFHGRWFAIPVGSGWIEVKEIVAVGDRPAYHIEVHGQTNEVLSAIYPIHDIMHSYVDVETLEPIRFEKSQREGHYRAEEVVTFDRQRRLATYHSLLNQSTKEIPLPEDFQDLISAFYWFRRQPIHPERALEANLYTDEKIYQTRIEVSRPMPLELLKRGTFSCLRVEPKASFKGLLVKRGRLWAYVTADERRLPLLLQTTTPWGPMSAVIDEASLLASLKQTPSS